MLLSNDIVGNKSWVNTGVKVYFGHRGKDKWVDLIQQNIEGNINIKTKTTFLFFFSPMGKKCQIEMAFILSCLLPFIIALELQVDDHN